MGTFGTPEEIIVTPVPEPVEVPEFVPEEEPVIEREPELVPA